MHTNRHYDPEVELWDKANEAGALEHGRTVQAKCTPGIRGRLVWTRTILRPCCFLTSMGGRKPGDDQYYRHGFARSDFPC